MIRINPTPWRKATPRTITMGDQRCLLRAMSLQVRRNGSRKEMGDKSLETAGEARREWRGDNHGDSAEEGGEGVKEGNKE